MQADFNTLRGAGLKAVVRFAYTQDSTAPFGDASKAQIISHLAQLGPVLQANGDVIAVVQAGFIGTWGEWAFTDHFGISDLSDPSLFADRREVLDGILDALPASRMVQLRTPFYKYQMFFPLAGTPSALVPLSPLDAHSGSAIARTGHHNDCFLASETDFGTYGAVGSIGADKGYLEVDTRYVPMGGETCSPNPPRSSCATALLELDRFHWSYLNNGWNPYVLGGWDTGGCMPEVKQRLGYRLTLVKGMYSDAVEPGGSFTGHIQLRNDGWAAPFNPRDVELVFRHTVTGAVHSTPLADEDPRFWLAGETQVLDHRFPANVPPGDYDLLLHLPDPEPSIAGRPEYAIRYANDGVWEEGTGYNALGHTVRVLEPAGQAPVADAGPDQNLACTSDAGATVTLDGSGSSGAPSTPLTYSWREGSLEIATGVSPTVNLALGAHTLDLVVDDGTAESAPDQVVIIVEDLIAPTISAALEEVRKESKAKGRKRSKPKPRKKKGSDDDSQSDDSQSDDGSAGRGGNRYRVVLSATDLCDSDPAISAHLAPLGVGVEDEIDVRYKRKRTNSIKVQVKRQGIRVTLEGPEQAALEGLWQAAVERGGFAVEDDQVIKLDRGGRGGSRDGDSSGGKRRRTLKFKFDADLKLTEAHVPAPILVAQSTDTSGNQSSVVEVGLPPQGRPAGKSLGERQSLPEDFLLSNYPNPFNPNTTIVYQVPEAGEVSLVIYNLMGQRVRALVQAHRLAGYHQVVWDGGDDSGQTVSNGIYLYRFVSPGALETRRMLLLK